MPRSARIDYPGAWHHVMNRGLARRTVFESVDDVRFFESLLARQIRAGSIEVHAFAVMTTHFHLLVRSPRAQLSDAMRRVQNLYVRRFNRERARDGPLFRGRFASRVIETDTYREAVLWYVDRNPVQAGLATVTTDYPHGSARAYAGGSGPPWLCRDWVESLVCGTTGCGVFDPAAYPAIARDVITDGAADVVEQRLGDARRAREDPLDDLVRAAPHSVQRWMEHKAGLADATAPGLILLSAGTVRGLIAVAGTAFAHAEMRVQVEAGLLRTVCGAGHVEIAARTGTSEETARRRCRRHVAAMRDVPAYAAVAARIVHDGLAIEFPRTPRLFDAPYALPSRNSVDVVAGPTSSVK